MWTVRGVPVEADSRDFVGPLDPDDFDVSLFVPTDYMREIDAVVQLHYEVESADGVITPFPSRTLTVDNNPPGFLHPADELTFVDSNIALRGITEAVLAANPFIEVRVPDYRGRDGRDRVAYYLSTNTPPFPLRQTGEQVFFFIDEPLILRIPADFFRALPNGPAYLHGRLYDRADNFSVLSAPNQFAVNLTARPSNLPAPVIRPPAYDDLLIKRDDARATVFAQIPRQYDGYAPGDEVLMYWDNRAVLPAVAIDRFPFPVAIPWDILRGTAPLVREEVPVRYEILRGAQPPVSSRLGFFWVDLTIAGQDHANAPALLNPTLERVEVFGLGSGLRDELDFRDRTAGAQVFVRLYDNPVPPERLEFYWNGSGPVAHYDVQPGDVTGRVARFTDVPGSVIIREGSHPTLQVFYTTSNGVNEQHSPPTSVNVHVEPLAEFSAPTLQHTLHGPANYLTCESRPAICHGVIWHISADARFRIGDQLKFYWQGFRTNAGEDPIADTDYDQEIDLNDDHLNNGVRVVVLPWDTKIEPMRVRASATASFLLFRGASLIGGSRQGLVRIDRVSPGSGDICQPGDTGFCDGALDDCIDLP